MIGGVTAARNVWEQGNFGYRTNEFERTLLEQLNCDLLGEHLSDNNPWGFAPRPSKSMFSRAQITNAKCMIYGKLAWFEPGEGEEP